MPWGTVGTAEAANSEPAQRKFRFRLRTKLLLSVVAITAMLTAGALLSVRHLVLANVQDSVERDLQNSANTFVALQDRNTATLDRMATLVADIPSLKALLTTRDPATIQDGTTSIAEISGAQLFVIGDTTGKLFAVHSGSDGVRHRAAEWWICKCSFRSRYWNVVQGVPAGDGFHCRRGAGAESDCASDSSRHGNDPTRRG